MRVLLDTCAPSELRRPEGDRGVRQVVESLRSDELFLSVLSVGEITKGIVVLRESRKKRAFQTWLQALERYYSDRILPVDLETSHIWGELTAAAQKVGKMIATSDGVMAATALRHGLHVMTRNTEHFEPTGALLLNPWMDARS